MLTYLWKRVFLTILFHQELAPTPAFIGTSWTLDGNPFIDAAAQQVLSDAIGSGVDTDGDGIDDEASALLRRRLVEVGPRSR